MSYCLRQRKMALFWMCTSIPNKDKCGSLQMPCDRACGGASVTDAPTPSPSPSPTDATTSCGNVPSTCSSHISWAMDTGRVSNPEWYADFYDVTGAALTNGVLEDFELYFFCKGINADGDCNGLQSPCNRECGSATVTDNPTPSQQTPAPTMPSGDGYCNWNNCNGDVQGGDWCN